MATFPKDGSIRELQEFCRTVYSFPNDRHFGQRDMLINVERFVMRGLKGVRKKSPDETVVNLLIATSWFCSFMNRLHIDLEEQVWLRFPGKCSYCGGCPCQCGPNKYATRQEVRSDSTQPQPASLAEYQEMFRRMYPPEKRSLEKAGIHLAEEMGELAEAILIYGGNKRGEKEFRNIELEAADFFSCVFGVFNSLDASLSEELALFFQDNCNVCHKAPCQCDFEFVMSYAYKK